MLVLVNISAFVMTETFATPTKSDQKQKFEMVTIKASFCLGKNYKIFKTRSSQYDDIIKKYSKKYGVEVALIKAVITAESCFNSQAVSPKGAQGLMQLIPATAERFGVTDSFNTDANIRGGTRYLQFLLKYFKNDFINVIAAYNSGEGTVKKYKGIPPYKETVKYVEKVSTLYRYYNDDGGTKKKYKNFKSGNYTKTFFKPRAIPRSRYSPYKNLQRNIPRGKCRNRTSTRMKQSTRLLSGNGVWQRVYTVKQSDTLRDVVMNTGVHKSKLMQMNGIRSRAKLRRGQELLIWECRR